MRPKIRYLKGNKGTEGPTSLLFFDTESYMTTADRAGQRSDGRLRLWVAAYVRRDGPTWRKPIYHRGHCASEFWSLVERLSSWRRPLWAFAHNLGWDLTQLDFWTELEKWRWTAGPVEREPDADTGKSKRPWRGRLALESRPTFLVVRGSRGILKLVDTGNYWPTKLDAIGEHFGVPKLPHPDFNGPEGPLWTYCTRDVDVCRVAVCELLKFWLAEDCGTFQLTGPMLAMTNFRHRCTARVHGSDKIPVVLEDESPARPLERDAYLGGRVEPFFLGTMKGPLYRLDCNSLYPSVMRSNLFPCRRVRDYSQRPPGRVLDKMAAFGAVASVLINTREESDSYPVRRDGIQVHACGRFWTSLCGVELRRALVRGHVERVGECHLYAMRPLFAGWVDLWLERKVQAGRDGDTGQAEFCKLILNSLAGKFGQRGDWWVDDPTRAPRRAWGRTFRVHVGTDERAEWRYVAGHTQKRTRGNEPATAFPAISAYVTSYARAFMSDTFARLPARSVLYTATDSIICTQAGFDRLTGLGLVHPDEPGKFRLLGRHNWAEVRGPNWYLLDAEWTRSGMWGRARLDSNGRWVCDVWDKLGSLMGSNPHGRCGYTVVPLERVFPTVKNAPDTDGWRVPLRLSLDPEFTDSPRVPGCHFAKESHAL